MTDAVSKGAEVLVGGARNEDLGPLFYHPSVAVGVSQEMKVTNEETFGPLAAIMRCVVHVCTCIYVLSCRTLQVECPDQRACV